MSVLPQTNVG